MLTDAELRLGDEVDLDEFAERYGAHEQVAAFRHREQLDRIQARLFRSAHAAQLEQKADRRLAAQEPGRRPGHAEQVKHTEGVASC